MKNGGFRLPLLTFLLFIRVHLGHLWLVFPVKVAGERGCGAGWSGLECAEREYE
jgi:hypothetical protein